MKYLPWFQTAARYAICASYHIIYRIKIIGRENIPEGGCFVCANHPSVNDPPLALVALGTKYEVGSMGKKELFDNKPLGMLLTALGGIGVDRNEADLKAIKFCLKGVKEGKKFILFPEGTRTEKSGKKAKQGIGMITIKAGVPVVPLFISRGPKWFQSVTLAFGEPIIPPKKNDGISAEEFSQMILDASFKVGENNGYYIS